LREAQAFSSRPLAKLAQAAKIAKNSLNSWGSNIFFSLPIYAVLSALCGFARECFFSFLSLITPYCLTSLRDVLVPLCLHYRLDTTRNPLNVVSQASKHQQEAIFARAAPIPVEHWCGRSIHKKLLIKNQDSARWRSGCTKQSCQEHGSIQR